MSNPLRIIARIHTDFPTKFGVPRQSGLIATLKGRIIFEPEYRSADAVRGLDAFSHIWLIWEFSASIRSEWSHTVRPPVLGGNTRMGVFATRSPFRPNPIGLSAVRLDKVELDPVLGPVLHVAGVDLMNDTPIYDIKPYISYADAYPEASGGFTENATRQKLAVCCPDELLQRIAEEKREALLQVLSLDPRPSYQHSSERIYGVEFAGFDVRFRVNGELLEVCEVEAILR